MPHRPSLRSFFPVVALLIPLIGLADASHATMYTITDTRDVVAVDLSCTFREALMAVTDRVAVDICPAGTASNTIALQFGTYDFDQGAFVVPFEADPLDLTITGLNGALVATRVDLGDSNGFINVVGSAFGGAQQEHRLRLEGLQIQNAAGNGSSVLTLSGTGALTLEGVNMVDGRCVGSCSSAISAGRFSDVTIRNSFFARNDNLTSVTLTVESDTRVVIENTTWTDSVGGLQIRASETATVEFSGVVFERAGLDAATDLIAFLDFEDDSAFIARDVAVRDNIELTGSIVEMRLRNQATALIEDWAFDRNQSTGSGSFVLAVEDSGDAVINRLNAANNTVTDGFRAVVDIRAVRGSFTWTGGEISNNFSAGVSESPGVTLRSFDGGFFLADQLVVVGNRHVSPASQAGSAQAQLVVQDDGSEGFLRNSVIADSPGLGIRAEAFDDSTVDLANLTVAGNDTSLTLSEEHSAGIVSHLANGIFFDNGVDAPALTGSNILSVGHLIGVDPLFVDAPARDYRIGAGSPAIDTGLGGIVPLGNLDVAGRDRFVSGTLPPGQVAVDVGAHEFQPGDVFADGFETGDVSRWTALIQQ
ncbi:MAG: hypothetical protein AAGM22_15610 [Acidobacteriota bacterium]